MYKKQFSNFQIASIALLLLCSQLFTACKKESVDQGSVYKNGPGLLVKFLREAPSPNIAFEGSIVTYNVAGLKGKKPSDFEFFINQTLAEVVEVGETTVKVKVPSGATTGACSILINGEYYFGPSIKIRGLVGIDDTFNPGVSYIKGNVLGIIPAGANLLVYGDFTDFNALSTFREPIRNVAMIDYNGKYLTRFFASARAANGYVSNVLALNDKFYLGGSYSTIAFTRFLSNIARLSVAGNLGAVDSVLVDVVAEEVDPANPVVGNGTAYVPEFNAGLSGGGVVKLFYNKTKARIDAVGNFVEYSSVVYDRSTKDQAYYNRALISNVAGIFPDGRLDSTFNFDPAQVPGSNGANGTIYDAIQLDDGRIVAVGSFTAYNKQKANRIVCIDPNTGSVVSSFVGNNTGANADIGEINYNKKTKKILLSGSFTMFNDKPSYGVVMLNTDGTVDESFKFRETDKLGISYAGQIEDGRIIVSGLFSKYGGNARQGLVILNPDGSMAAGCNNFGPFVGSISDIYQYNAVGLVQLMLVGDIRKFDGVNLGGIVKIRIRNQ